MKVREDSRRSRQAGREFRSEKIVSIYKKRGRSSQSNSILRFSVLQYEYRLYIETKGPNR